MLVPPNIDPAVEFVLSEIETAQQAGDRERCYWRVETDAGLGTDTIRMWPYRRHKPGLGPRIGVVRRALNALGYDLAVVRLGDDQPD